MVTKESVIEVQEKWGNGVVKIGSLKENRPECEAFASEFLDERYAFDAGTVLFKPTKCAVEQFRATKSEAQSYFIAGDDRACAEDGGFAINPWTKVRFENTGMILEDDRAIAMGNYFFTDLDGNEAKVEYTFGYKLIAGALKIDLHHSSFPFPNPSYTYVVKLDNDSDTYEITLNNILQGIQSELSFTPSLSLSDGLNVIQIRSIDEVGNYSNYGI